MELEPKIVCNMRRISFLAIALLCSIFVVAQENLQRQAINKGVEKVFTTVKELPITSVKNQYRSGTFWDYATLGYFES